MARAQIEIDIPDDCEISEGPVFSSALWNDNIRERPETGVICFHVIVRRVWQWPSWLKVAAIAMDEDGCWWTFSAIPKCCDDQGQWSGYSLWIIEQSELDFTPPPCTDWRQSLRLNPNREAKS